MVGAVISHATLERGRIVIFTEEIAMENSQLVVGVLFVPVLLQILLPLALLLAFLLVRFFAPMLRTASGQHPLVSPQAATPGPQKV